MESGHFFELSSASFYELEEKRSRFLCYLLPCTSRQDVTEALQCYRARYTDARHHCSAYIIGNPRNPMLSAYSDDGEPAGTAGKPMLRVMEQRGLGNALTVVVRYFGGIKLGAGGLVRAYGNAVSQAIDLAHLVEVTPKIELSFHFDYALESRIRHKLHDLAVELLNSTYQQQASFRVRVEASAASELERWLHDVSAGAITIEKAKGSNQTIS